MTTHHSSVEMNSAAEEKLGQVKRARFLGAERTTRGREHQSAKRLKGFAFVVLLLSAVVATFIHLTDVTNYISSVKSFRGLKLDFTSLNILDDENPRVLMHLKVKNHSPLEIEIEGYWFDLYLAGEIIGRSYSMYRG